MAFLSPSFVACEFGADGGNENGRWREKKSPLAGDSLSVMYSEVKRTNERSETEFGKELDLSLKRLSCHAYFYHHFFFFFFFQIDLLFLKFLCIRIFGAEFLSDESFSQSLLFAPIFVARSVKKDFFRAAVLRFDRPSGFQQRETLQWDFWVVFSEGVSTALHGSQSALVVQLQLGR